MANQDSKNIINQIHSLFTNNSVYICDKYLVNDDKCRLNYHTSDNRCNEYIINIDLIENKFETTIPVKSRNYAYKTITTNINTLYDYLKYHISNT